MLKRYRNYSKRIKTDHLESGEFCQRTGASDGGLRVLCVRLDLDTRRVDCGGTGGRCYALTFR